ncbi:DJ-1 family glyoxalase III [Helicobacter sp. 16-1353]|uniref:DJ-1 family glyoxalase III n=1 Tax=Helicobacter sp. 16-1353 TaxID=2004996 RepID=UPI00215C20F9|nr:DJ-1 family glyoxalase III [Helicobacter sp. 16-1353]
MNVLVPLMQGFEEIEFVSIVDTLRRAEINVVVAKDSAINEDSIKGAHNISIKADCKIADVNLKNIDGIVLPGGYEGMMNLKNSKEVLDILENLNKNNKLIAAICAAPIVLGAANILKNKFSCYPGCENAIKSNAKHIEDVVCIDGNIITSIGPASGILFALEIVRHLKGDKTYDKVKNEMLVDKVYA